jgi:hypothetical protein
MVVVYQAALGKPPPELRGELQIRAPLGLPVKLKLRLNLVKMIALCTAYTEHHLNS